MALDIIFDGHMDTMVTKPDMRRDDITREASLVFGSDSHELAAFLNRPYKDAGGLTPLDMAGRSESGLTTARCLLKPRSGC